MFFGLKLSPKCNPKHSSPVVRAASLRIQATTEQGINPSALEKTERSRPTLRRISSGFPPATVMASSKPVVAAIEIIGLARTDPSSFFFLAPIGDRCQSNVVECQDRYFLNTYAPDKRAYSMDMETKFFNWSLTGEDHLTVIARGRIDA